MDGCAPFDLQATSDRPWPYREIARIDKEIRGILESGGKKAKRMGKPQQELYIDEYELQILRSLLSKRTEATREVLVRKN